MRGGSCCALLEVSGCEEGAVVPCWNSADARRELLCSAGFSRVERGAAALLCLAEWREELLLCCVQQSGERRGEKGCCALKLSVGNAVTDNYYDSLGTVTYWWTHSMISDHAYRSIINSCNFTTTKNNPPCDRAIGYAMNHEFGDIDQYNIYTPSCAAVNASTNANLTRSLRLKNTLLRRRSYGYDPCTEHYAERYYNRPEVQQAMHANSTGIPYKWTACSDMLIKTWDDSQFSMLPTYKELIKAGIRIWVFSGDTDSVVPITATRFSISHLNLKVKIPWYPWYSDRQVGGWTEVYKGLTFVSVRGAGHEVPLFQPRRAFLLFQSFLAGKSLPKS